MHPETASRVKLIRSKVSAGRTALSELTKRLTDNQNKFVQHLLRRAAEPFDDLELHFLGLLESKSIPARGLSEELEIVSQAEFFLARIAQLQLWAIEEMIFKFGRTFELLD